MSDTRERLARLLDQAEDILAEYNPVKMSIRDTREPDQQRKEKLGRSIARVVRRRLSKQLERLYFQLRMAYPHRGMKAIGDVIDFDALFEDDPEEAQELIAMILQGAQGGMDLVKLQTRLQLDYGLTNAEAAAWARRYSYELIKDIDKTTRDVIRSAVTDFIKDPDYSMADLFDLLEPQFGRVRAERIAVTEVTRAYSQGQRMARETIKEQFPGVAIVDRWYTNNDDLVCPLCGPLDGEERKEGEVFYQPEDAYQDGYPPRHPNCRCWINTTTRIGKSLKYSDDQPRDEAGRWTDGGGGSGGIVAYSPRVQSIYGGIPEKIRELAPPPEVIEESLGTTRFQFGTIYIDADSSEKRTSVEFAHEYAHYIDYKNDLSSSPEFQKVISESVQRSLSIEEPEIPPSSGDKDFWKYQTYARTGATVTALTQGEKGWMGHSREYLQVGDRASREVFALGFEAYVNYDPSYFKAFPEMKSYFKQLAGE